MDFTRRYTGIRPDRPKVKWVDKMEVRAALEAEMKAEMDNLKLVLKRQSEDNERLVSALKDANAALENLCRGEDAGVYVKLRDRLKKILVGR